MGQNPLFRSRLLFSDSLPSSIKLKKDSHTDKTAVVLGSGVGDLPPTYELLSQQCGIEVIVLKAQNRTGGQCLSLRTQG